MPKQHFKMWDLNRVYPLLNCTGSHTRQINYNDILSCYKFLEICYYFYAASAATFKVGKLRGSGKN
jgi:hypothetical protein